MKKLITIAMLFIAILTSGQDTGIPDADIIAIPDIPVKEESAPSTNRWRTITVGNLSGVTVSGYFLTTFSLSLSYELKKEWSINSWAGVNYNYSYNGGWGSVQVTANKTVGGFNLGGGMMYGAGAIGSPFPEEFYMNDLSFIVTISKRFRLP